jgi:hypothetical protein
MAIAGDGEAPLPTLIEACKRALTPDRKRALEERGARLAELHQRMEQQTREQAALGWDSIPLAPARASGGTVDPLKPVSDPPPVKTIPRLNQ